MTTWPLTFEELYFTTPEAKHRRATGHTTWGMGPEAFCMDCEWPDA